MSVCFFVSLKEFDIAPVWCDTTLCHYRANVRCAVDGVTYQHRTVPVCRFVDPISNDILRSNTRTSENPTKIN